MSAVSTTGEKTFLQKWKILNSIFAMARIAVCCRANDLGKSRRILLPQQCAIRLASELRLLGLSEEEANDKLFEWNERNSIDVRAEELRNVARSGYQHRFPYRYSCRDEILRRFCPLPNYESCRKFVAEHAQPRVE